MRKGEIMKKSGYKYAVVCGILILGLSCAGIIIWNGVKRDNDDKKSSVYEESNEENESTIYEEADSVPNGTEADTTSNKTSDVNETQGATTVKETIKETIIEAATKSTTDKATVKKTSAEEKDTVLSAEESETVKDTLVELPDVAEEVFDIFIHQTTNTVWNGTTSAKVMHPDQLKYLQELGERWYEESMSVEQVRQCAYDESPIKTNEDMYQLTGFYQQFIGDAALFRVVDVDIALLEFKGKKKGSDMDEGKLWQMLCDLDETSASPNFLFVKAGYSKSKNVTYVYYLDAKLRWTNNNFDFDNIATKPVSS